MKIEQKSIYTLFIPTQVRGRCAQSRYYQSSNNFSNMNSAGYEHMPPKKAHQDKSCEDIQWNKISFSAIVLSRALRATMNYHVDKDTECSLSQT
jgi:hypothetical protein